VPKAAWLTVSCCVNPSATLHSNDIATLDKVHGEPRLTAAIFVSQRFVTDLLILLGHTGELFVAIHERKIDRLKVCRNLLQRQAGAGLPFNGTNIARHPCPTVRIVGWTQRTFLFFNSLRKVRCVHSPPRSARQCEGPPEGCPNGSRKLARSSSTTARKYATKFL
jgi:hypothetical protein